MKTLREMMDQLDEISRRDLLKGAAAAAMTGAASGAKSQTIGGGEDDAKEEALKAASEFYRLSRKTNVASAKMIQQTIYQRLMQFYNFGGQDLKTAANYSLSRALQSVMPSFQQAYDQAEKEKDDSSLATAYLSKRLGLDKVSNDEQLKRIGSLERFNLMPLAEHFVKVYTQGLQAVFDNQKKQTQAQNPNIVQRKTNADGTTTITYKDGSQLTLDPSGLPMGSTPAQRSTNEDQIDEASPESLAKIDQLFR